MILLTHATGNENVRQAAQAFLEAGLLGEFWTAISWNKESTFHGLLPGSLRHQLERRSYSASVRAVTYTMPRREAARLLAGKFPPSILTRNGGPLHIDAVLRDLDQQVARRIESGTQCHSVYAYEDGARAAFRAAESRRLERIYDLPIGYWSSARDIYREECAREPAWAATLTGAEDSPEKLAQKDDELRTATRVIVASSFTRATLANAPINAPLAVVPYGAPPPSNHEIRAHSGKLRVLFAGSLGQRKGLSYLLEAIDRRGQIELTLLGRKAAAGCAPLDAAVRRHRWIPSLPHAEVLREMQQHDVLVLPSLFEGFGLVILEAMSQGLVVITTPHTAGPDVITDGLDGFVVPIRSAPAIAEKLELLASNPEQARAMKIAARARAAALPWSTYRARLVTAVTARSS